MKGLTTEFAAAPIFARSFKNLHRSRRMWTFITLSIFLMWNGVQHNKNVITNIRTILRKGLINVFKKFYFWKNILFRRITYLLEWLKILAGFQWSLLCQIQIYQYSYAWLDRYRRLLKILARGAPELEWKNRDIQILDFLRSYTNFEIP
jgi:hypothetical protein